MSDNSPDISGNNILLILLFVLVNNIIASNSYELHYNCSFHSLNIYLLRIVVVVCKSLKEREGDTRADPGISKRGDAVPAR